MGYDWKGVEMKDLAPLLNKHLDPKTAKNVMVKVRDPNNPGKYKHGPDNPYYSERREAGT